MGKKEKEVRRECEEEKGRRRRRKVSERQHGKDGEGDKERV